MKGPTGTRFMFNMPRGTAGKTIAFGRRMTTFFAGAVPLPQDRLASAKDYVGLEIKGPKGTYKIEEKIGEGGLGQVYKGTRLEDGEEVAIKIGDTSQTITVGREERPTTERFWAEAFFLKQFSPDDDKILRFYDYFEFGNAAYLVTELLVGEILSEILKQVKLSVRDAVEISIQILDALSQIHSTTIIHRDLKPDNVFICEDAALKIIDFGVSRVNEKVGLALTTAGITVGTPEYMSPEQIAASNLDVKADLYSFGIILYEMLAGVVPYKSTHPDEKTRTLEIRIMHIEKQPAPVRNLNPLVSKELEAVVLRLLAKDKEGRYESADQVKEELVRLREAELLETTPDTRSRGRKLVDRLLKR